MSSTHGCRERIKMKRLQGLIPLRRRKEHVMKKIVLLVLLVALASFSANAVLVNAEDDAASKAYAKTNCPWMCSAAGWDVEGGTRYGSGSGALVCNDVVRGAYVVTAKHCTLSNDTGQVQAILRYCFEPSYYDGFPKGTTGYLADKTFAATAVFLHPSQDIALVKLERLVYSGDGTLVEPISLYR